MTKEELAALLNGREYRQEMTREEEAAAKAAGLLVIFGASDDLTELRGAIHDEAGAYYGTVHRIDRHGFVGNWDDLNHDDEDECEAYFKRKGQGIVVGARWSWQGYSWWIEPDVPYAAFDIVEDGEKYCRGVVIDAAALASPPVGRPSPTKER